MQNLPTAETYAKEVKYMPLGILISEITDFVVKNVPQGGAVLDLLCGTGNLLGELQKRRSDISFTGVDLDQEFIEYASRQYTGIKFVTADVSTWASEKQYDCVLVTGGLHHLPYEKQDPFVKKTSELINSDGFAIIADPYIDDYSSEEERKIAAAKLGYEYLIATIKNGATDDVIKATASLIENDLLQVEFKSSVKKVGPLFRKYFTHIKMHKAWPREHTEYGDYYFILKK